MLINTDAMVSMRDANQNFSKVARQVETNGPVVILKNNRPHFILMSFEDADAVINADPKTENVSDELIAHLTKQFADNYEHALRELAK